MNWVFPFAAILGILAGVYVLDQGVTSLWSGVTQQRGGHTLGGRAAIRAGLVGATFGLGLIGGFFYFGRMLPH